MKTIRNLFENLIILIILFSVITITCCHTKEIEYVDSENKYDTISLKDGLDIIYGNIENNNLYVYEYENNIKDRVISRRRARKVKIEGLFSYAYSDFIVLDNIAAGDEVYDDICIYVNQNDDNIKKLIAGDKVTVIGTIMTQKDDCSSSSIQSSPYFNKFYVVSPLTRGYDKQYDKCIIEYDLQSIDTIYQKYINKDIIYDYDDIYEDIISVVSENPKRFIHIFDGLKFKTTVKMDEIYKKYSFVYLGCVIDDKANRNKYEYVSLKYGINSIHIGDGKFVFGNNELYLSYDDEYNAVIDFERNKYKNWYEEIFQIKQFNINFFKTTNIDNNIENSYIEEDNPKNDYNEEQNIKVIGKDDIFLGDMVYFGKKQDNSNNVKKIERILVDGKYIDTDLIVEDAVDNNYIFNVIKVDNDNPNKVLIMLNEPLHIKYSDDKKCTWHDSFMREYLNVDLLNNSFSDEERKRMYQIINNDNLYKVFDEKDKESIDVLFPLTKDEIMENHLFIPMDTKGIIRYQEFSATEICLFDKNSYSKNININSAADLSFPWPIYPCIWVNIDKEFNEMENSAYDYKF